jgi:phenylalanyl-tRNA synthetase beta chain
MNVSYEWLRAFVPFGEAPAQLRDLITAHAATVDELIPLRADLEPIVVARVVEEAPHPDSDHLHVTKVDAGTGTLLDVVCGAPNVTAGRMYPFAPSGTSMPGGMTIVKRKIRGAVSDGMLCSARELGLGDDQDGILELDVDVPPGTPLLRAVPVGDVRLVIDVGANRPDLLSHLGVAREVGAVTGRPLAFPSIEGLAGQVPAPATGDDEGRAAGIAVRVEERALVRRFMGVVIRGVTVGPSPAWLVARLESVGSRSINNIVDASNYVLHELGQPTHAFDLATLSGASVVVRRARAGETITTLDGADRALGDEMIVIADASRPQAIAGIVGGRNSEVTDATTDLFVEVANFDPGRVRAARRALGLSTDASYRFERGVDVEIAPVALERVAQLILLVAGGSVDGAPIDLGHKARPRPTVELRTRRVAALLGEALPVESVASLLRGVGFEVSAASGDGVLAVTVPSWRNDVTAEVDLIEEVARLRGYDNFPDEIRAARPGNVPDDPRWIASRRLREALVAAGLLETRPMPFVEGGEGFARLENPLAENEAYLRRDILDTLARRAEFNLARMQGDVRIFEIGSVFKRRIGELPLEELRAGILVMGRRLPPHFTDPKSPEFAEWVRYGEWDAKSLGELAARVAYPGAMIAIEGGRDELGALWQIRVDGELRGAIRRVPLDAPVWAAPAFGIELSLGSIDSAQVAPPGQSARRAPERPARQIARFQLLPSTPAAEFDLALLVPDSVEAGSVEDVIRRVSGDLLERIELFDRYVGTGVEMGHRSLAWRLTFRHRERTLRDKEIEGRRAKILGVLADELNVRHRTS